MSCHPQQDSFLMKEVGVYGWPASSEGNFTWCWFSHIHLPKLEIKFSLQQTSLHTATTGNYLTEDTTEEEDLCDELILSEILGVVKGDNEGSPWGQQRWNWYSISQPNGEIWRVTFTRHSWVGRHGTHLSTTPSKRVGYKSTNAKAIMWPAVNPTEEGLTNHHPLPRLPLAAEW